MAAVSNVLLALALVSPLALPAEAAPLETFHLQIVQAQPGLPPEAPTDLKLEEEATVRHAQLQWHQGFGLATLGSMALTAGLGLYTSNFTSPSAYPTMRNLHMALGGITTGLYMGAATLALSAPKGYDVHDEGWDAVTIHRSLAWLHAAGLVSTVTLGILTSIGRMDPKVHGILGGSTLGLMALSAGVIVFDF
ncbi:MAG TPA: hypothetical protein V6D05_01210 [Stenomitos sp.]